MASSNQSKFIADLVVKKTKEFKEVKEILVASGIVTADAEIVKTAGTIDEITHALTDLQASKFIDVLTATKDPARGSVYSKRRIEQASTLVTDIKKTISEWSF
jgi:hypothetical protein